MEWNGDGPGQTEVELAGRKLVEFCRVERISQNACGFQVPLKLVNTGGESFRKINCR